MNNPSLSLTHLLPSSKIAEKPYVTLLVPALNEQLTIGEFVDWCHQGLKQAKIDGQILIIDSSTDQTAEIALAHGAEVLKVPKRGLGRAYIDAIPYVRGKYIIMGDADLTYDFKNIQPFLECFRKGYDFVIGSRIKGKIEKGAMPILHRYFGNPVTTHFLNLLYGARFTDIHCGMRGMSLSVLKRMQLHSQSWQYATEIVIKAKQLKLNITEIPINFFKDKYGRESHHLRTGWYSPWIAGLMTMKAIIKLRFSFSDFNHCN